MHVTAHRCLLNKKSAPSIHSNLVERIRSYMAGRAGASWGCRIFMQPEFEEVRLLTVENLDLTLNSQ